jgi:hypothetical protein
MTIGLGVHYVGFAEAMSIDGRQAVTLTNFDPPYLSFAAFPITWPLALIAVFVGDDPSMEYQVGLPFTGQATVFDPSGQVLVHLPAAGVTQPRPFDDLPPRFFFGINVILNLSGPGNYRLEMSITVDKESVMGSRDILVRGPVPALGPFPAPAGRSLPLG